MGPRRLPRCDDRGGPPHRAGPSRRKPHGDLGVELWRLHDELDHQPNKPFQVKAAVVGAAVTDVPSFVRTTDVPERFEDYLGKDQKNYHRSSPMYYADSIRTPTLIWHGDDDIRVPLMQGRHLYTALKKKSVPTEFVIYHGEAHGIRNPEHQRDLLGRKWEWLSEWVLRRD